MARWKLIKAHYCHGRPFDMEPGEVVEWEYKETDRVTGRERRKRFKVPFYFPEETIVCYEGRGLPTDSIFEGSPTPEMEPLDDEARVISEEASHRWGKHPIDGLPMYGNDALLADLQRQLAEAQLRAGAVSAPPPVETVSKAEFDKLKAQLELLMSQQGKHEESARRKA